MQRKLMHAMDTHAKKQAWYIDYQAEQSQYNYAESSGNWLDTVDVYMGDVYYPWELGV